MELFGAAQKMRVVSWIPGAAVREEDRFPLGAGRWYRTEVRRSTWSATRPGFTCKTWPRDEAEPAAWTIEAVDPQPNREGSAGLYANSHGPALLTTT